MKVLSSQTTLQIFGGVLAYGLGCLLALMISIFLGAALVFGVSYLLWGSSGDPPLPLVWAAGLSLWGLFCYYTIAELRSRLYRRIAIDETFIEVDWFRRQSRWTLSDTQEVLFTTSGLYLAGPDRRRVLVRHGSSDLPEVVLQLSQAVAYRWSVELDRGQSLHFRPAWGVLLRMLLGLAFLLFLCGFAVSVALDSWLAGLPGTIVMLWYGWKSISKFKPAGILFTSQGIQYYPNGKLLAWSSIEDPQADGSISLVGYDNILPMIQLLNLRGGSQGGVLA